MKFCDKIGMIGSAGADAFELLQNMFAKSHWETSESNEQECVKTGQIGQPFWKGIGVGVELAVDVADSYISQRGFEPRRIHFYGDIAFEHICEGHVDHIRGIIRRHKFLKISVEFILALEVRPDFEQKRDEFFQNGMINDSIRFLNT